MKVYDENALITDVINNPVFGSYGRLIFPVDDGYYSGDTLGELRLTWYNDMDARKTVEIVNYLRDQVTSGNRVFYDIYAEEEKQSDPDKEDTGLFFFRGTPGEKFAVCNAGGGFACVGESDGIASWKLMKRRLELLSNMGIDTEFYSCPGLRHGFGIGTGTVAEGWLGQAVAFWEKHMD